MFLVTYRTTALTHDGQTLIRENQLVTLRKDQGAALIQRWSREGKRTGRYQYELLNVTPYRGNFDALNWVEGADYAHLPTPAQAPA